MDTTSFYALSADVLATCHDKRDDLSAVLDPETGFAPRLSNMCKKRLREASEPDMLFESSREEIHMLRLESDTWDLLQTLMSARKTESTLPPTAKALLRQNPYTPTATLAQSILLHSPLLSELVVVREWLHDTAPEPHTPETAASYWKFTRLRLLQAQRTGNKKEVDTLVSELDPDAGNRNDGGKVLSADDANYEKALAQALYGYIRAGRLEDAIDLCRRTRRPWRAASIRGSLLFQWRALANESEDEDNADADSDFADGWSGNKRRKLWKQTCTRAALNPLLSEPDRALYAALAPSPASSVVLKAACRTWYDHLWAHVGIICEGKQVDALARAGAAGGGGGGFWEGGADAVARIVASASVPGVSQAAEEEEEEREEREWEREVIRTLEALANVGVTEGPPANDPFHASQLHIILNRTDKLLSDFAAGLQLGEFDPQATNFPSLTRFFAHLCLFLQIIDVPVPADATQIILEVYLQVLEEAGQREHIALYASALGENAVERYAMFLTSLDLSADLEERREALLRAEKHSLDMVRVAQATAEKTIERAFEALPRIKVALPPVVTREAPLSDMEWFLIRSIEWTTFMEQTYTDALEQANVIFRYFLGCGKVQAAKVLLTLLPAQLKLMPIADGFARTHGAEYVHYLQFFAVWDLFDRIVEAQLGESACTTKGARENWLAGYKTLLDETRERVVELLTTEWLVNEEEATRTKTRDQRHITLVRIRRIYIPELVIRLHALLVGSGDRIPRNLTYALDLANTVADSRYHLFEDFLDDDVRGADGSGDDGRTGVPRRRRLEDYLRAVRQAVLRGLEAGGSDPLRILHAA
ncbi:107-domain-containing protein [Phellopilus nigrolimitatus]|nr:107-domain-containing protein [Phellopilus nigrolimitatus]